MDNVLPVQRMATILRKRSKVEINGNRYKWQITRAGWCWPRSLSAEMDLWLSRNRAAGDSYCSHASVWFAHRADAESFRVQLETIRVKLVLAA